MALQCQSFRDKFYHIPNLFKFYYELNETDEKIARAKKNRRMNRSKKNHSVKKEKNQPTEQVQIVLTMIQTFEWCKFSVTFFSLSLFWWFNSSTDTITYQACAKTLAHQNQSLDKEKRLDLQTGVKKREYYISSFFTISFEIIKKHRYLERFSVTFDDFSMFSKFQ